HTMFSRDWSSDVCSSDLIRCLLRQFHVKFPPFVGMTISQPPRSLHAHSFQVTISQFGHGIHRTLIPDKAQGHDGLLSLLVRELRDRKSVVSGYESRALGA